MDDTFFYVVGPIIVGYLAASIVFQLIHLPILVNLLVTLEFGFTRDILSGILQFLALFVGFACIFLVPLVQGYCYRLFRSGDAMPDTGNLWGLFFNGWRINITLLICAIPLILIYIGRLHLLLPQYWCIILRHRLWTWLGSPMLQPYFPMRRFSL